MINIYLGGIIIVSFAGMYFGSIWFNYILIESFTKIFNFSLTQFDVIKFYLDYVLVDLILVLVLIVISALFPLIIIRKIKPVNILKAKE